MGESGFYFTAHLNFEIQHHQQNGNTCADIYICLGVRVRVRLAMQSIFHMKNYG